MSQKLPITQAALKGLGDLWVDYRGEEEKKVEEEKGSNRAGSHRTSKPVEDLRAGRKARASAAGVDATACTTAADLSRG